MEVTAIDVIERRLSVSCEQGDSLKWGASLPNDSIDLVFCSPPYMRARTYGREDVARGLEEWVAWMVRFVTVFSPKCKGLIAINCEGQTRDYQYMPAPFLLVADLHRAGFNLRKPPIFHRVGIPGSGGPDWLRNDYEPIICVTRPGKLPWSDNTACGHPPKWAPGGEMSNRLIDGSRVNKNFRGAKDGTAKGGHARDIVRTKKMYHRNPDGTKDSDKGEYYVLPAVANPGNLIQQTYTADEVAALLAEAGDVTHHKVGGGQMGHNLAHKNEAPFPLSLAEFFVRSYCPPGGVVCDPFMGSSTTGHACINYNRRYIGCDLRESQVELSMNRLMSVQPAIPDFGDDS